MSTVGLRLARGGLRLTFEARLAWSWGWLIAPILVAGWLWLVGNANDPEHVAATFQLAVCGIEILLPLGAIFVGVDLLPREQQQFTIVLLGGRTRLWAIIGIRTAIALGWMMMIALLGGLSSTRWCVSDGFACVGLVMGAALPSAILMLGVVLCLALLMTSPIAGTFAGVAIWLIQLLMAPGVATSPLRHWLPSLLFFGWSYPASAPADLDWVLGKNILLGIAAISLLAACGLTRSFARYIREPTE